METYQFISTDPLKDGEKQGQYKSCHTSGYQLVDSSYRDGTSLLQRRFFVESRSLLTVLAATTLKMESRPSYGTSSVFPEAFLQELATIKPSRGVASFRTVLEVAYLFR